jgi:D-3-phosphoglycerate dehydrogenase
MENLQALFGRADYVTLHLPLLDATEGLVNEEILNNAKSGLRLLNFSREGIVDDKAAVAALREGKIDRYLTDFPSPVLQGEAGVVTTPHLGASTAESEENCAVMAADQLRDFLENGNITNAVNFPPLVLERTGGYRIAVTNRNVPRMLGHVLSVLADADINVVDMLNKSRDDIAYNLLDLEACPDEQVMQALGQIEGVINVRLVDA